ncbi:MAG: amino acid adenylation domain-containing protein [Acidobacteria bacterium]|nr:amino acid adenylation domain-containing protein [Acidobacteriota bacterium]
MTWRKAGTSRSDVPARPRPPDNPPPRAPAPNSFREDDRAETEAARLPLDFKRPDAPAAERRSRAFAIAPETEARLFEVCGDNELLIFAVLVAALKVYLHKCTGVEEVVVGTPVHKEHGGAAALNEVLALRDRVGGELTFKELLLAVRQTLSEAYRNQKYPFDRILDSLGIESPANRTPLFAVAAALEQINDTGGLRRLGTDLIFSFAVEAGRITAGLDYKPALFRGETVELVGEQYAEVLRAALAAPDGRISELSLLSADKKLQLVSGFNDTAADYPADRTIHQLFAAQAERTPDRVAVLFREQSLTYGQLDERARRLALHLRGMGIGAGSRVAILMEHSVEEVVAVLGVLKAGAAYLPLDPRHPKQRLSFVLADAGVSALLAQQKLTADLPETSARVVAVDDETWAGAEDAAGLADEATPQDLAYVIYTSGSTGVPKGVRIQHRSLVNYVWWAASVYLRGESLDCALYSSLAFDLTVTSIFMPLITGNAVVVYDRQDAETPLAEILKDGRVGVLKLTPSHLSLIKDADNRASGIRRLIVGGEAFESKLAGEVWESFGGRVEIFNEYGPTEATVGCMIHRYDPEEERAAVPVGRPAANTQIYVLDDDLQPAAENVVGELYIAGDGLADGYLDREELTAERFVSNPFAAGGRMYRSGDLARHLPGGVLEYVGRRDEQVKYHGYRVELNEIRSALNRHPLVKDSAVTILKDKNGHDVMAAYYVARQPILSEELRALLAESVYEETLPGVWMHLRRLPLTLNGKVNLAGLPGLEEIREQSRKQYVAPRTETEGALAGIWSEVLGVERVGVEDNFFELGGHSLLATQVISRACAAFRIDLPLRSLFEARTVAGLALLVEQLSARRREAGSAPPIARAARGGPLPLSFAQQRLWFMDQMEPGSAAYNVPAALRLEGRLDADALRRALGEVVRRHESLRTSFAVVDGESVQIIAEAREVEVPVLDLRPLSARARDEESRRQMIAEAEAGFDLQSGPLLRARLLRLDDAEHLLLFTMHHIVSDGWSQGVLVREVGALYAAYAEGQPSPLPELELQYADYAAWQREWLRGEVLAAQLSYWRGQLGGELPVLTLPTDRRRGVNSGRGRRQGFSLNSEVTRGLRELGEREGATLYMTLLAAFQTLLHRYTGQEDVAVGTAIANRTRPELEQLIGFFVNTLVLRTDLSGDPVFVELLRRVREVEPANGYGGAVKFDLVLNMQETEAGLAGSFEYSTDLFDDSTVERMTRHFETLLRGVVADAGRKLSSLPLLEEGERRQILEAGNAIGGYRREAYIHRTFEAQAALTPDAPALRCRDEQLSYRELNARSNQIAHGLRAVGVGPRQRVAVMTQHGPRQIAALLGTLKAGAGFVCLDPDYPASRLRQILEEIEPACLVSDAASVAGHAELVEQLRGRADFQLALLDGPRAWAEADGAASAIDSAGWLESLPCTNPDTEVDPGDLAYVVYTSGSTGRPKGIVQSHDGLCQFIEWAGAQFEMRAGKRVAQWAAMTYDAAYVEVFGALCSGATLCLTTPENKGDPRAVIDWVRAEKISLLQTVPSFCRQILNALEAETGGGALPRLELMLLAGETIPVNLAGDWLERFPLSPRLYNLYGPTESILATFHAVEGVADRQPSVPAGRAIEGRHVLVLDRDRQPCPVGVPGEIYIRSPYLTAGYFGRPAETQKKFSQNPLHDEYPDRVYATGDVGRWLPAGELEFLGRGDSQVKLRGIRIELEEIEAKLLEHRLVGDCAVAVRDVGEADQRLVAYVLKADGLSAPPLRALLEESLPGYMIPTTYVFLDALPRTASGKINRPALPEPDEEEAHAGQEYVAPATPLEAEIAETWRGLLRVERVGAADNFFHLGGHSLLAAQMINTLRQRYAVELPLRRFMESPTVNSIAAHVEAARRGSLDNAGHLAALLDRIRGLSDEEVRTLLEEAEPAAAAGVTRG